MQPSRSTDRPQAGSADREQLLKRFEAAWQKGPAPQLEAFLPPVQGASQSAHDPVRRQLLEDLIKVDLDYRWRQALKPTGDGPRISKPPCLEDYLPRYAELGGAQALSLDLIGDEYRIRRSWGDRPSHHDYLVRFGPHGTKLQEHLRHLDTELAEEFGGETAP